MHDHFRSSTKTSGSRIQQVWMILAQEQETHLDQEGKWQWFVIQRVQARRIKRNTAPSTRHGVRITLISNALAAATFI